LTSSSSFQAKRKTQKRQHFVRNNTPPQKKTMAHCHHLLLFKHREECNNITIVIFLLIKYKEEGDNIAIVAFFVAKQQPKKMK
jgi:hypothetical protein